MDAQFIRRQTYLKRRCVVNYLSAEFPFIGRLLLNNLINMALSNPGLVRPWRKWAEPDTLMEREESRALATVVRGSPAVCDSLGKCLEIPAMGYRHEFGISNQKIQDGWQVERRGRAGLAWQPLGKSLS